MAKVGRKPIVEITDTLLKKIEELSALGLTVEQVANSIGMGESTFYKYKAEKVEIQEALKKGQARGVAIMAGRLLEHAKNGSTSAAIFYLKCHGWKEANQLEVSTNTTGSGMADFYKQLGDEIEKAKK